ncbi:hypothetical protein NXH76_21690 [Blautia schinkii]|nr:hypothetical protein [Blautia schinkii]
MKKMRVRLALVLIATALCVPSVSVLASTDVSGITVGAQMSTREPAYEWVYKFIDGKLYKRLFNIKSGEYIGEWIPVV